MRYIRKKRLAKGFVGCFLMTYMCFVLLNVMQYNIIQHIQFVYQGDEPDDIPIIREKVSGSSLYTSLYIQCHELNIKIFTTNLLETNVKFYM